jgi:hypothetical protein
VSAFGPPPSSPSTFSAGGSSVYTAFPRPQPRRPELESAALYSSYVSLGSAAQAQVYA